MNGFRVVVARAEIPGFHRVERALAYAVRFDFSEGPSIRIVVFCHLPSFKASNSKS